MRIVELLIDKLEELTGFDAVALVEEPAIEADFMAFNNKEVLDTIKFEVLKLAMKEKFVERRPGEGRDEYIARCIPVLKSEGYADDQAAAICYDALKLQDETEDVYELIIGDYQTRHYDICPGASNLYKKIESGEIDADMGLAIRAAKLQDALFWLEKHTVKEMQSATFDDVQAATVLADEILLLARMMGLEEEHSYIPGHVQAIIDVARQSMDIDVSSLPNYTNPLDDENYEFESYTDYPQSATNAAKRVLKWKEEHPDNDCLTRVGIARANQLANRRPISEDTISRMASFARHLQHEDVPYSEGCGGMAVDAWGGRAGIEWAKNKLEEIRASKQSLKKSNVLLTKDRLELLEKQSDLQSTTKFKFGINEEQMKVIGPMLIPDKLIMRIDEQGEPYFVYFSKETVKAIAEKAMKNKLIDVVNLEHDSDVKVDAFMTSSWIVENSEKDKSALYGMDLPVGSWVAEYKIEDLSVWEDIKKGVYKGFSIEGIFQNNIVNAR